MSLVATLALLPTAFAPANLEDDFDVALGQAGLSTATARFDDGILLFYRQGDRPAALYQACHRDPWRIPFYTDMARRQLALAVNRPNLLVEEATRELGKGVKRSLLGDPAQTYTANAKGPDCLDKALKKMQDAGLVKGQLPSTANVPQEVKEAASAVLQAALVLIDYRRAAFARVPDLASAYNLAVSSPGEPSGPVEEEKFERLRDQVDMGHLYAAAEDMGAVATWALALCRQVPPSKAYAFRLATDWGLIDLSGGSDSTHDGTPLFLCVDTGGNDTYINNPCNGTPTNWLSVTLDTNGDDRYLSDPALAKTAVGDWPGRAKQRGKPGPGAALFGLSFLFDSDGKDLYRSARSGFGSARYGVAYLGDSAGDDVYDSYGDSEGFGWEGIGILDDSHGSDRYSCFTQSQGVGLPRGYGLLMDSEGDDVYEANDKVLDFPSAQTPDHNTSMAQGAGYGFRGDYLTGHSQSGGLGVLYDLGGKDTYSCGVFGQGVGYWEGAGFLWDSAGNDEYTGQWYVQGASAHFGVGELEDLGGDDQYHAMLNMAQGAGHDFGVGFLLDANGNDRYQAPNLSLGAGNANAIGIFVDQAGDDRYTASGTTLGSSSEAQKASLRERAISLGLFLDLGGNDSYPDATLWARNGSRAVNWIGKNRLPAESQVGVFLDR